LVPPPTMTEVENYRVKIGLSPKPMMSIKKKMSTSSSSSSSSKMDHFDEEEEEELIYAAYEEEDEEEKRRIKEDDKWWHDHGEKDILSKMKGGKRSKLLKLCHRELNRVCMRAAEALWLETEGGGTTMVTKKDYTPCKLIVMWSGGIDSTGALVALIQAASKSESPSLNRLKRLFVVLDEESMTEYPYFYKVS
jgi:hypothetical protein